ncbi:MAG: response regulator transcription factor [Solirubrobacteraceae bacterium]|nr:response regulator transcription factor [Solirubrobacteraceae bacterium]
MAAARILVVDDEESIRTLIATPLRRDGHRVDLATTGPEALERFDEVRPDLVVLDARLPGMDGLEVCRRLRSRSSVAIIIVSARDAERDRVDGLDSGADDYVTKPFSIAELRSRVRALLRRAALPAVVPGAVERLTADGLVVDPGRRRVEVDGEPVELTHLEFELLATLMGAPGRVFTRDQLLDRVWGGSAFRERRTVDVHVLHLREKIEPDPRAPRYVETVRGLGYRFVDPADG